MNKCEFIGRMTADPKMRNVGDKQVANFSMAIKTRTDTPVYINCEAWGKSAEVIARYAGKGKQLGITSRLSQHSYEKDGVKRTVDTYVVEEFDLLGGKNE